MSYEVFVIDVIDFNDLVCIAFEEFLVQRQSQYREYVRYAAVLQRILTAQGEETSHELESRSVHDAGYCENWM